MGIVQKKYSVEDNIEKWYNIRMKIDELELYYGGKIEVLKFQYLAREIDREELELELYLLDDDMTDDLEDDVLSSEQYAALKDEIDEVLALDVDALEEEL